MRIGHTYYMDYQATTPVDPRVFAEMAPYFNSKLGNPHSTDHCIGWEAAKAVDIAANRIANLIGADSDEIIFTSGATEANNLALSGIARRALGGGRRRILMSSIEHKSIFAVCRNLHQQLGLDLELIPVDKEGFIEMSALEEMLDEDVLLVSVMAVNNEIGTIQDIAQISDLIRKSGAMFHCDAVQAPCAIDIHQFANYVDLMSLSSHKMYGPQGIGALFVRRELQEDIEPIIYGGGQQNSLRSGTLPVALCVGMGVAASLFEGSDISAERECIGALRDSLVSKLMNFEWPIILNGPQGSLRHPANANIRFDGCNAQGILQSLQPYLAASTGSACTSGVPESSHVLAAIGLSVDEAESSIRFSIGRGTQDTDIVEVTEIIENCLKKIVSNGLV